MPALPAPHRHPDNTPYYSLREVAELLETPPKQVVKDMIRVRQTTPIPEDHFMVVTINVTDADGNLIRSQSDAWVHPAALVIASAVYPGAFPDWIGATAARYAFGYKITAPAKAPEQDTGVPVYRTPDDALTVTAYLRERGIPENVIASTRSEFGKRLRAVYTERRGHKPSEYALTLDDGKVVLRPFYDKDTDLALFDMVFTKEGLY